MAARIKELKELNNELTRRKSHKRKRIQTRGVLEFGKVAKLVAIESPLVHVSKKRVGSREGSGTA